MKLFPSCSILLAVAASFTGVASGAVFFTNFDSFNVNQDVAGQGGWVIDDDTPAASFVGSLSNNPWGARSATLGYVSPLNVLQTNPDVYLSHAASTPMVGASFSVLFQVQDSDSGLDPARDTFGFRLENSVGYNLFSFILSPFSQATTPQDPPPAFHTYSWSTGAGAPTVALPGLASEEFNAYTFSIAFTQSGGDLAFTADVNGAPFTGTLNGLGTESIAELGAFWKPLNGKLAPGSNFLIFDEVTLIPEASSALLGLLGASLTLVRRRRI